MSGSADLLSLAIAAGGAAAVAALVLAAASDLENRLIPDRCSLVVAASGLLALAGLDGPRALGHSLLAAFLFGLGLWAFRHRFLGGGDVKLMAAAGLWAGPGGLPLLLSVQAAATLLLATAGLARTARSVDRARATLPLGVAIAAGGTAAVAWRLGLLGPGG
ncbi:prepilin peptidase [Thermaurantiacus sp.]